MLQPKDKLSKWFRFYECYQSETAARYDIDNVPQEEEIIEAIKYHGRTVLDPIRGHFGGFSPTSWYRCHDLEKKLCYNSYIKWCEKRNVPGGRGVSWGESSWFFFSS